MIWTVDETSSTVPETGPLRDAGVWEEALVYDQLWRSRGLTPVQVDDLKLWHIGIMIGASEELRPTDNKKRHKASRGAHDDINRRLIRERIRHSKGLGPMPEAPGVSMSTLSNLTTALGGR